MEAPDRIYINGFSAFATEPVKNGIEYIRKDALLKWLDGKMTIEGATEGIVGGYDMALKDVIDKLNDM